MADTVLTSTKNSVCTIALNRPERLNAINSTLLLDFRQAISAALIDNEVGAIVLRGAGRAFCSGDDLKEFDAQSRSDQEARRFIEQIQDISRSIIYGDKIFIGAIHGWAVGGGLEWAINCDLSVFANDSKCFFPEVKWGMFPTGGITSILPRTVGLVKAKEMLLLGETYSGEDLFKMGLAWRAVDDESVFDCAQDVAEKIAALPQSAVSDLKRALTDSASANLESAIDFETEVTVRGILDPETYSRVSKFGQSN